MTVLGPGRVPVIALLAAQLCGCGMKGPPQAPFVRVPAAVGELVVQRLGDEVSIGFTLPTANEDNSEPASLARVDVYAMTTRPRLTPERTLELEELTEAATLVASFDVAPPPDPEDTESEGGAEGGTAPSEAAAAGTPPAGTESADPPLQQGDPVLLAEALTAEAEVPVDPWEEERRQQEEAAEAARAEEDDTEEPERPVMVPLMTPPLPGPLQREYVVVQVSEAGDESEGGERIAVPLGIRVPEPPPAPEVVYTETTADVTWELPPGVRETVQGPATAEEAEETDAEGAGADAAGPDAAGPDAVGADAAGADGAGADAAGADDPAPASGETPASDDPPVLDAAVSGEAPADAAVAETAGGSEAATGGDEADAALDEAAGEDEAVGEDEAAGPPPPLESRPIVEWPPASTYEVFEIVETDDGSPAVPARLSETPLEALSYSEPRGEYGVERCYAVRTLDVVAGFEVRSRLSPVTCVTFVDTFAPAAPEALTAVGSEGEVSLLWRPNDEEDLAGYVVLRGLPGDETLQPLTDAPLVDNTYRDVSAEPGVRHVYAVRAVDDATAPNLSEPSDRVEAAAR
ncbi:MAG: fibronectin type III domain-containing protein [Acidobacteria bacterium]|nr:fibronectin type III domain-containing protein [Acidobacteriota bacterium]